MMEILLGGDTVVSSVDVTTHNSLPVHKKRFEKGGGENDEYDSSIRDGSRS